VSENTANAVTATKKTAERVAEKVANVDFEPVVVEITEVALDVPSKLVVPVKTLLIGVGVAAAGTGIYFGVRYWRNRKNVTTIVPNFVEEISLPDNA
jgi:hypothetical protein